MDNNGSVGGMEFGFNKTPETANDKQKEKAILPVEEHSGSSDNEYHVLASANDSDENEEDDSEIVMNSEYLDSRSISIALIRNYSLYRKANDKVLQKKTDYIGGSISASRIISSNKSEIEAYFPGLIGLAPNNPEFITRIKQYLNNIRIPVDELNKTFNTSFLYNTKRDYYRIKREIDKIENAYNAINRNDMFALKAGLKDKITKLNAIESTKHNYGNPVELEDYLMYRHCLLYNDVAKDVAFINSDTNVRFYFKDDQKEAEKNRKHRGEINKAKVNYVGTLTDDILFNAVYIQYLASNSYPVIAGMAEDRLDREVKLDRFSNEEPVKFNKICNNKDVKLIGDIELMIAKGELQRSQYNQNINTSDGSFVGANMNEALAWFKNPDNSSVINAFYNKLKHQ